MWMLLTSASSHHILSSLSVSVSQFFPLNYSVSFLPSLPLHCSLLSPPLVIFVHWLLSFYLSSFPSSSLSLLPAPFPLPLSPGGPADRAGLKTQEVVIAVNAQGTTDLSHQEVVSIISNTKTAGVWLTICDPTEQNNVVGRLQPSHQAIPRDPRLHEHQLSRHQPQHD